MVGGAADARFKDATRGALARHRPDLSTARRAHSGGAGVMMGSLPGVDFIAMT